MYGLGAQGLLLLLVVLAITVIGLVVIASKKSSRSTNYVRHKRCPFCAEIINVEAKFCRFCGKDLTKTS
jgi:rRNA maturation endonuclease Nob1